MSGVPPTSRLEDSRSFVSTGVPCASCGYNLRGLTARHACPECGTPASRSLQGDLLRRSDPSWLGKIRLGVVLILANILIQIAMRVSVDGFDIFAGLPFIIPTTITLFGGALGLWATLLITAQEPRMSLTEDAITLRRVIRACAVAGFLGVVLQKIGILLIPGWLLAVTAGALMLVGVVAHFGQLAYLRRFARRIPHDKLANSTTAVMWGFVIALTSTYLAGLTIMGLGSTPSSAGGSSDPSLIKTLALTTGTFGSVGLLVFSIAYIVLLVLYSIDLTRVCEQARRQARASIPATAPGALFVHRLMPAASGMPASGRSPRKTVLTPVPATPTASIVDEAKTGRLADLTASLWRQPNSPKAHYDLAVTLANRGRFREAVQQYEDAVRLKDDFVEARLNLANCLARVGRTDDAIRQLQIVLTSTPASPAAHYNLGNLLLKTGQTEVAIRHYRDTVATRPGFAGARYNLGIALLKAGRPDQAARQFRAALLLNPGDARISEKLNIAMALWQNGGSLNTSGVGSQERSFCDEGLVPDAGSATI